jgi:hypothetical protein
MRRRIAGILVVLPLAAAGPATASVVVDRSSEDALEVVDVFARPAAGEFALLTANSSDLTAVPPDRLRLIRIGPGGRRIGAAADVTPRRRGALRSFAFAYNTRRDEYLLVHRRGAEFRAQRFSGAGRRIGRAIDLPLPQTGEPLVETLDYVPATGAYLLTWTVSDEANRRLRAQPLSPRGRLVGVPRSPFGRWVVHDASTTYDSRRDRFLAIRTTGREAFRAITAEGRPAGPRHIVTRKYGIPVVGYSRGRDAFLAVDYDMNAGLLTPGGRAFGPLHRLAPTAGVTALPNAVVSGPSELLVAWSRTDNRFEDGVFFDNRARRFGPAARRAVGEELRLRSPRRSGLPQADGLPRAVYSRRLGSYLVAWPVRDDFPAADSGVAARVVPVR